MASTPHIFVSLTAHGYGHLAQVAPVVAELAARLPRLRLTLQADLEPGFVRSRLPAGLRHLREAADPGLRMTGPLVTRWDESLAAYEQFVADEELHLTRQREILAADPPDLVLGNVPWVPLAAARSLGIPAVSLSSLNWNDVLIESPVGYRVPTAVGDALRQAYGAGDLFIRPAPSMPMTWLPRACDVGPIARLFPCDRAALRRRFGVVEGCPLVLVQFGGFAGLDPLRTWPLSRTLHWLVPDLPGGDRPDATSLAAHGLRVPDVLGACDAMIAKPGYGTFVEAACNGIPVLFVSRNDWPEEPYLTRWLAARAPVREIGLDDLMAGRVAGPLTEVLAAPGHQYPRSLPGWPRRWTSYRRCSRQCGSRLAVDVHRFELLRREQAARRRVGAIQPGWPPPGVISQVMKTRSPVLPGCSAAASRMKLLMSTGLVLALGLGMTYGLWQTARYDADQVLDDEFHFWVSKVAYGTAARLTGYVQVLRGVVGLFDASVTVSRQEFSRYVAASQLELGYPGIQGVGFSAFVPAAQKAEHVAAVRREGFPDYDIRPGGERGFYTAVVYVEPFAGRNLRAFGYDMAPDPVRWAAAERARDQGLETLSGRVTTAAGRRHRRPAWAFSCSCRSIAPTRPMTSGTDRRVNLVGWAYLGPAHARPDAGCAGDHRFRATELGAPGRSLRRRRPDARRRCCSHWLRSLRRSNGTRPCGQCANWASAAINGHWW